MIDEGIFSAIGNTPLIKLTRVLGNVNFKLYAKLESVNPGGSSKDRPAMYVFKHAIESGAIKPGTVVIESSSGNMGIGLAQACRYFGLRFICVVDPRTTQQNIRIIKAYGAEIDLVEEPDPIHGDFLTARLNRVKYLVENIDNAFWPNQYANQANSTSHYQTTMAEIAAALRGEVDYIFCATSTCGTIRGCAEYIVDHNMKTRIIAVDAVGSVIFGGKRGKRLIPGFGAGITPPLCQPELIDECVYVSDVDCIVGCRRLVHHEAILAGGSSGGALMGVDKLKHKIPWNSNCVVIFPDRGERYLDTVYNDEWVNENFGKISYLWEESMEAETWETTIY